MGSLEKGGAGALTYLYGGGLLPSPSDPCWRNKTGGKHEESDHPQKHQLYKENLQSLQKPVAAESPGFRASQELIGPLRNRASTVNVCRASLGTQWKDVGRLHWSSTYYKVKTPLYLRQSRTVEFSVSIENIRICFDIWIWKYILCHSILVPLSIFLLMCRAVSVISFFFLVLRSSILAELAMQQNRLREERDREIF